MKAKEILQQYIEKSKSQYHNDQYSALLFALQIPSICGRLDFPYNEDNVKNGLYKKNGKPIDSCLYEKEILYHLSCFRTLLYSGIGSMDLISRIYSLRCQLTHEGYIVKGDTEIIFTNNDCIIDDILFITIPEFCNMMFEMADKVFSKHNAEFSTYNDLTIPDDVLQKIKSNRYKIFDKFWNARPSDDQRLNMIYEQIFGDNTGKALELKELFKENPDKNYIISVC